MAEIYPPSPTFQNRAYLKSLDQYHEEYQRSIEDPEIYWAQKAEEFHWYKRWESVNSYNTILMLVPFSSGGLRVAGPASPTTVWTATLKTGETRSP